MTRSRLEKMSPGVAKRWKTAAIHALLALPTNDVEKYGIANFFNQPAQSRGDTHTASSSSTSASPPASTPGKRHGKKKTDTARKRGQKRTKAEARCVSPARFYGAY